MGMFDTLHIPIPCPKCNRVIDDWQTKDLECSLAHYTQRQVLDQNKQLKWLRVISECPICGNRKVGACEVCKNILIEGDNFFITAKIFLDEKGRWNKKYEYLKD